MTEQAPALFDAETLFARWGAELTAALAQTLNGVYLRGSRAVPVCTHPAAGGGPLLAEGVQRISNSAGRLTGWSFNLPTGAAGPAQVDLYDGTDNTGTLLGSISLTAGASSAPFTHHGIAFVYGLYADITGVGADAVRGAVYLGATE
ncbi:MAG: hypothetical protein HOV96_19615 [Nonomuraea sp.]|nr:hypothetical protein [Nonomuraea sp.]